MKYKILLLLSLFISCKSMKNTTTLEKQFIIKKDVFKEHAIDGKTDFYYMNYVNNNKLKFKQHLYISTDNLTNNCCSDTINSPYLKSSKYYNDKKYLLLDDLYNTKKFFVKKYYSNKTIITFNVYKVNMKLCKCKGDYINYTNTYKDTIFICPYDISFLKINRKEKKQIKFILDNNIGNGTD